MDVYLVEGHNTVFRIALAILKANENELVLAVDFNAIHNILRDYMRRANSQQLFEIAFDQFKITDELIEKQAEELPSSKDIEEKKDDVEEFFDSW